KIPKRMGLRHRAAIGITEQSDAIAIIISEQTGKIALSKEGEILRSLQPAKLKTILEEELT
ncbi:MAG: DNA integrity scanning protein DisA nucleotide-binding domain protein, partial [Bacteroidales bacterium]|nr:DNA integrity scanning protein DisA nucleotide-binding domain protein [Bacteroidales bacterium]